MSIKPEYVNKIFSGIKKYEYRKIKCKSAIDKIIVYSTSPVKKVVGELIIDDILCGPKENIWEETSKYGGIEKSKYDEYFKKQELAFAYKIKKYIKYKNEKDLSDYNIKIPPQSYIYLN
jgi:predicted transcriptional regulator